MWTRHHKRRNTGRLIVPAITGLFLAYFGFHAYHGDYGIYSKYRLETRIAEAQARLDVLVAKRKELEHRVALVNDGSLEKDMLDERARLALNLARKNEVIILIGAD
ncbi:septum formation initiator family protein [Nitratireductor kimnyeongensis]|uniref:Septum formation initiator family protein n=1 Tax=Nitratireductor kimnyeongensis TaxID=430679 RepID=A0ABW0T2C6_9HYPH|nr:septum formation initiator family protein [Nitratireductor kimnyeongensis]QZZ35453.1 septum formation initiator family protein [Nitratireductor kimnyeongensis]